jgi:hypothetical protein
MAADEYILQIKDNPRYGCDQGTMATVQYTVGNLSILSNLSNYLENHKTCDELIKCV